jgi:hypothetical protein
MSKLPPWLALCRHIHFVRGHRVVLQHDLARLYAIDSIQIQDHARRFPGDLCFTLEAPELESMDEAPLEEREPVYGFTEHGALALAYALNSPAAVAMSLPLVRAFGEARQAEPGWRPGCGTFA